MKYMKNKGNTSRQSKISSENLQPPSNPATAGNVNEELEESRKHNGIEHKLTARFFSNQNGIAEIKTGH